MIDYRRFNEWLELQAIGGTGLLYVEQVVADGEDDGLKCGGTGAIPSHVPLVEKLKKSEANQVMRAGKTFEYGTGVAKGLLPGKKATLLMASGGVYEHGTALAALNFATPYLRAVLGFMSITDVNFINAEGTSKLMTGDVDPQAFLAPSLEKVHVQASL